MSDETKRKISDGNRRRGQRNRAALAEQLAGMTHLTHAEAGRVLGRDPKTIRSVRAEFNLSSATRPTAPYSAERRAQLREAQRQARQRLNGSAT